MIIRDEHFAQYLQQNEPAFVALNVAQVRENTPYVVDGISDESLQEMVTNGLLRARSHGFTSDEDQMVFVAVMFEVSPNFDEQPDIRRILADKSIPAGKRFDALFAPSLDEAWEEAARNINYRAWHPGLEDELDQLRREAATERNVNR